jgi:RND family efflux transporter MFP subunit
MRNWIKYAIIGLVVIVLIFAVLIWRKKRTQLSQIPSTEVKFGEFRISLKETGTLRALKSQTVNASGWWGMTIAELVPEGTYVNEGDFLVRLTHSDLESRMEEAESELKAAQQSYEQSLADHKLEKLEIDLELKRAGKALKEAEFEAEQKRLSNISTAEKEKAEKAYEIAKAEYDFAKESYDIKLNQSNAKLEEAKFKLESAKNQLARYRKRVEEMTIYSPGEGLVVYTEDHQGEKIKVGSSAWRGQKLIELPDLSKLAVDAEVNEVDIGQVEKGQKAIVRLDAFPELSFEGEVSEIATLATPSQNKSGAQVFNVDVLIDETDEKMKPGMTASVEIIIEEIPEVLYLAKEAIFEKQDTTAVFLKKGLSHEMKVVTVGKSNENFVVVEDGLEKDDKVYLRDPTVEIEKIGGFKEESEED